MYSEAESGNMWPITSPSSPKQKQYFFVMNGEYMMTFGDDHPGGDSVQFDGRPSLDSQNLTFLSFANDTSDESGLDDSLRTSTKMSVYTSAEFHTPMGPGASGDDSVRTLSADTPTMTGDDSADLDVPLNLSALSQTRETPPLRKAFVRRKKSKATRETVCPTTPLTYSPLSPAVPLSKSPVYTISEEPEAADYLDSGEDTDGILYDTRDMLDESDKIMFDRSNRSSLQLLMKSHSDPYLYQDRLNLKKRVSFSQSQEGPVIEKCVNDVVCPPSILKNTPPRSSLLIYHTPTTKSFFHADTVTDSVKLLKQRLSLSSNPSPNNSCILEDKGVQCCLEDIQLMSDEDGTSDDEVLYCDQEEPHQVKKPVNRHSSLRESFTHKLRSVFSRTPSVEEKSKSLPHNMPAMLFDDKDFDLPEFLNSSYTLPKDAKLSLAEGASGDQRRSVVPEIIKELMEIKEASCGNQTGDSEVLANSLPRKRSWFLFRRNSRKVTPEKMEEEEEDEESESEPEVYVQNLSFESTEKTISYLEHMIKTGRVAPSIQRLAARYELFTDLQDITDNSNNNALGDVDEQTDVGKVDTSLDKSNLDKDISDLSYDVSGPPDLSCSLLGNNDIGGIGDYDKLDLTPDTANSVSESSDTSYRKAIQAMVASGELLDTPTQKTQLSDYEKRMQAIRSQYMADFADEGFLPIISNEVEVGTDPVPSAQEDSMIAAQEDYIQTENECMPTSETKKAVTSDELWNDINESLEAQKVIDTEMSFLSDHEDEMTAAEAEFVKVSEDIESYPDLDLETFHVIKMKECEKKWQDLANKDSPSKLRKITDRMLSVLKSPFRKIQPFGIVSITPTSTDLSIIEEAVEENSLAGSRNVSYSEGQCPLLSYPKAEEVIQVEKEVPECELVQIAKQVVSDVYAQISLQQSIKILNTRVVLLNESTVSHGIEEANLEMTYQGGGDTTQPAKSSTSMSSATSDPFTYHSLSVSPSDSLVDAFYNASDTNLRSPEVSSSFHEEMIQECTETWRRISMGKIRPPLPGAVEEPGELDTREESKEVTRVPRDEFLPKKSASMSRKKHFMDRLRKKTYPYPPTSEWKGRAPDDKDLTPPEKKESVGILKRLSLRRSSKPVSSTPKKIEELKTEKKRGRSLLKRFSLKRSAKPPQFLPATEPELGMTITTIPAIPPAETVKKPKRRLFANLLRRLTLRRRRRSVPIPEVITNAVANSQVDRSLESSQTSSNPATSVSVALSNENTATSVVAMQGSCASSEVLPLTIAVTEEIQSPGTGVEDTSITFSASSLTLPDNTKSPMTKEIYRKLITNIASAADQSSLITDPDSPARPSMAIDSFTYGDSSASQSTSDNTVLSQHARDLDDYFKQNVDPDTDLMIATPDREQRNRLSLYDEMGAVGGLDVGDDRQLSQVTTSDSFDHKDMQEDIKDMIASLLCPYQLDECGEGVEEQSPPDTEDVVDACPVHVVESVSLDDVNPDVYPPTGSPGEVDSNNGTDTDQPRERADGESSAASSLTSEELLDLISNTSENAQQYYMITSGSLSPSVKTESQSESESAPCTPASQSGLPKFETLL